MSTECQHCVSVKLNQHGSSVAAVLVRAEEKWLLFSARNPKKKKEKLRKASDHVQSQHLGVCRFNTRLPVNKMTLQSLFQAEVERPLRLSAPPAG